MKKLITGIALFVATGLLTQAYAQETTTTRTTTTTTHHRTMYYYYPETNVYNNPTTGDYYYYDAPTTTWTTVKTLPSTISVTPDDRATVYYSDDPWKHNSYDKKRYKAKKNGKVKEKTTTN